VRGVKVLNFSKEAEALPIAAARMADLNIMILRSGGRLSNNDVYEEKAPRDLGIFFRSARARRALGAWGPRVYACHGTRSNYNHEYECIRNRDIRRLKLRRVVRPPLLVEDRLTSHQRRRSMTVHCCFGLVGGCFRRLTVKTPGCPPLLHFTLA
jgi:hypothetical protein